MTKVSPFPHAEGDLSDREHTAGPGQDLLPGLGGVDGVQDLLGLVSKHLPEVTTLKGKAGFRDW